MLFTSKKDIFESSAEALIHQANRYHTMASGIAREIRECFPEAYAADLQTAKDSLEKLGSYSVARIREDIGSRGWNSPCHMGSVADWEAGTGALP